jgi:hypothetical protein
MFGSDYLELMALPKVHPSLQYFADFLAGGEGVGGLVLATDDASAAQAELVAAGVRADPPLALSRPVGELGEARFSLVQLAPESTPGFRTLVCQHHTREIVWRREYQQHAIGARAIESVVAVAPDPGQYRALLGGLPVSFSQGPEPRVGALRIRVEDRKRAADALKAGGFSAVTLKDGSLVVNAGEAHGVMLVFA